MTQGLNLTLNCDPDSWFKVKLWPGIGIKIHCGILTRGHNSTWNFYPESQFNVNSDPSAYLLPVELRLKKVSKFNSVIKIQELRRVTIQRKIHWILTPVRYSMRGSKFYLTPAWSRKGIDSYKILYRSFVTYRTRFFFSSFLLYYRTQTEKFAAKLCNFKIRNYFVCNF